ncbi:hypothetical protein ABC795_14900 [Blastococcus sp. HT6-30]|uniref:hypothetical protein n=1 Tax=Blastococcus sp. HT6-30 TaxID=3144843 RepID=UPI0032198262
MSSCRQITVRPPASSISGRTTSLLADCVSRPSSPAATRPRTTSAIHCRAPAGRQPVVSADVEVTVDHGPGEVRVLEGGSPIEGFYAGTGSRSWTDDGEPEIELVIHSGVGDVEVSRG